METRFDYDMEGRLVKKTFADGRFQTWVYENRRLARAINARGAAARFTWDAQGNLVSVWYSDGTPGVAIQYDAHNRPVVIGDAAGTWTYTYDAMSRLVSVDGPWEGDTVALVRDARGRVVSLSVENGPPSAFAYDSLDRLVSVAAAGDVYSYTYTGASSLCRELRYPDGAREEMDHDAAGRMARLVSTDASGALLEEYSLTRDSNGLPLTETVTGALDPALVRPRFAEYAINTVNQMTARNAELFFCDADGNMTGGVLSEGVPFTAVYDAENRLAVLEFTDREGRACRREYVVRADGFPAVEKMFVNNAPAGERRFIRLGPFVLEERDGQNTVTRRYVRGLSGSGPGTLLAIHQGGEVFHVHTNIQGDVTLLRDSRGTARARYAREPHGVLLAKTGDAEQPMGFRGGGTDPETGLVWLGRRVYHPLLGRWLGRNPAGEAAGVNLYTLTDGNPLDWREGRAEPDLFQARFAWERPGTGVERALALLAAGGEGAEEGGGPGEVFEGLDRRVTACPQAVSSVLEEAVSRAGDWRWSIAAALGQLPGFRVQAAALHNSAGCFAGSLEVTPAMAPWKRFFSNGPVEPGPWSAWRAPAASWALDAMGGP
jgi:RHS repeat-associated protein